MGKVCNDVLLEILSYLDYHDLKRCMRVNKTFKAVTERSEFDRVLFRSQKIIPDDGHKAKIDLTKLLLHPVFESICYSCGEDIETATLLVKNAGPVALTASSAANEKATYPTVSCICVRPFLDIEPLMVQNAHGITVLDIMKEFERYYEDCSDFPFFLEGFCGKKHFRGNHLMLEVFWSDLEDSTS